MKTAEVFPVFGQLHAEEAVTSKDTPPTTREPVPFVISSRKKRPRRQKGASRSIDRDLKVLTELMSPDFLADDPDETAFDLERALRSISFLLDYLSGRGN